MLQFHLIFSARGAEFNDFGKLALFRRVSALCCCYLLKRGFKDRFMGGDLAA